ADRGGDPAGGGLAPRLRRGDPCGRGGALPRAPGRAPTDRRVPPRVPAARGGGCVARDARRPRSTERLAAATGAVAVSRAVGRAVAARSTRAARGGHRIRVDVLGRPPARAAHRGSRAARRRTLARPPVRREGRSMNAVAQSLLSAFDERRAGEIMREALVRAGITVGGDAPGDVRINDPRVYQRVLRDGILGVGESYTDGWWDCDAIDQMIDKVVRAGVEDML